MNNKFIEKLDSDLNKFIEILVKYYVKKYKYRHNKYRLYQKFLIYERFTFCGLIIAFSILGKMPLCATIIPILSILFTFAVLHNLKPLMELYDPLFYNRKNPYAYQRIKDLVSFAKLAGRSKRCLILKVRLFSNIFLILMNFITFFGGVNNKFGLLIGLCIILDSIIDDFNIYLHSVMDFDPPEIKHKSKVTLTELMKNFIENFLKQPLTNPIKL